MFLDGILHMDQTVTDLPPRGSPLGGSDFGEAVFGIVQILAHLVSRVSRPQFCWGLAILCDPPFFSGYIEFDGVVVKFYSFVEITLYLLADFLITVTP